MIIRKVKKADLKAKLRIISCERIIMERKFSSALGFDIISLSEISP